jgi:hypothetical protein
MEGNKVDEKKIFFPILFAKQINKKEKKTPWLDEAFICLIKTVEDRRLKPLALSIVIAGL